MNSSSVHNLYHYFIKTIDQAVVGDLLLAVDDSVQLPLGPLDQHLFKLAFKYPVKKYIGARTVLLTLMATMTTYLTKSLVTTNHFVLR